MPGVVIESKLEQLVILPLSLLTLLPQKLEQRARI